MPLRSIIVDDEPAARELLQELLAAEEEIEVIGSYGDPRRAIEAILRDKPDVLFLDIQMPVLSGFELLDALGADIPNAVVFVTAFDEHAVEAFDASAADYVLKPLEQARLHRAVVRAVQRARTSPADAAASSRVTAQAAEAGAAPRYSRVIPVGSKDRITLQRVDEVIWFEAQAKFVRVHTLAGPHLVRRTMRSLEARLNPDRFLRVSRSAIVNIDCIKHIEPWSHGDYTITLKNGAQVVSTQGYRQRLRGFLRMA